MPMPHASEFRRRGRKIVALRQKRVCEDRREMLQRDGRAKLVERGKLATEIEAALEIIVDGAEIVAVPCDAVVEHEVLTAVDGFLCDESRDLVAQLRIGYPAIRPHSIHEEAFPLWKRGGKCVEERRADGVPAQPPSLWRHWLVERNVARVNGQIGRRLRFGRQSTILQLSRSIGIVS